MGRAGIGAVPLAQVCIAGAAGAVPPVACDTNAGACWAPGLQTRWQYQLEGRRNRFVASGGINVDLCIVPFTGGACVTPDVFDIDLYDDSEVSGEGTFVINTAGVDAIHARGQHAICYLSAGDVESFRPDHQAFVDFDAQCGHCLIGRPFSPRFADEFWANINNDQGQRDFMLQMAEQRVQRCAAAGFDGVEFDVVDAYAQGQAVTGWDISAATQLDYNQRLANLAHALRADGGVEERPRPAGRAVAVLRLRDQRAVLPVRGVRQQPGARLRGLGGGRQGGVPGRVPPLAAPLLRARQRGELQLDQEERQLPAARSQVEAVPLRARTTRGWRAARSLDGGPPHHQRRQGGALQEEERTEREADMWGPARRERPYGPLWPARRPVPRKRPLSRAPAFDLPRRPS